MGGLVIPKLLILTPGHVAIRLGLFLELQEIDKIWTPGHENKYGIFCENIRFVNLGTIIFKIIDSYVPAFSKCVRN